ncbi:hypothetical protein HJD18_02755 [Thermoleophilia bacterium SCSIO 60948]|nr:hypothetical protein HJD18_02755 [Thermoleophilia bacterium SCSIO 60948]
MARWPLRRWGVALSAAAAAALAIGIPTGIVETGLYTRMLPVVWWNYPIWVASAVLIGLTVATYVRIGEAPPVGPDRARRTLGGSALSLFAVGCPICNKLVVGAMGTSGALSYWAPIQPALGIASVALLVACLVVRLRGQAACSAAQGR